MVFVFCKFIFTTIVRMEWEVKYLYIHDAFPPLHLAGTLSFPQFGSLEPKPSHHAGPLPSIRAPGAELTVIYVPPIWIGD